MKHPQGVSLYEPPQGELTIFTEHYRYRSPLVTALAWSCFSPPLITGLQSGEAAIVPRPQLHLNDHRRAWLARLDDNDAPLRNYMQQHCHSKRLGLVFESLWHFFLHQDPETELIGHNIPVRDNNKTLGEFDVLYYCHHTQQAIHLELAVKFFLGLNVNQHAPSLSHWFGPNRADRLDRKLARLSQHQLPLAQSAAGRATLLEYGIDSFQQQLHVSGILFHRNPEDATHHSLNAEHQRGRWLTLSEFTSHIARNNSTHWHYLAKPSWLEGRYETASELKSEQIELARARPIMAINTQQERLFIVPDHWPETL